MQGLTRAYVALAAVALAACTPSIPTQEVASCIQPPLGDLQSEKDIFTISAVLGDTLLTIGGATIIIPSGAIVEASGAVVSAPVEVHFQTFSSPAELLASGLPMHYTAPGAIVRENLESAGMFELRAFANGEPVSLAPEAAIQVRLTSPNGSADFDSFYLNETDGWEYIGNNPVSGNPALELLETTADSLSGRMEEREDLFALDVYGAVDVWVNAGKAKYGDALENEMKKKLRARGLKYYRYGTFDEVWMDGKRYPASFVAWKNLDQKKLPSGANWSATLTRISGDTYRMALYDWKTGAKRSCKVKAQHTLQTVLGSDASAWFSEYEQWKSDRAAAIQQLEVTEAFMRDFTVNAFGFFNADRFTKVDQPFYVDAAFTVDGDTTAVADIQQVYFLEQDKRTVTVFTRWNWPQMALDTATVGSFVAVLPGGELGILSAAEFEQLVWPQRQGFENVHVDIPLRKSPKVDSITELAEIM